MGLMDMLRKLGILKTGSVAATYTSAKDRPLAMQQDNVFGPDATKNAAASGAKAPGDGADTRDRH